MGSEMTCFAWQSRSSDLLDGTLPPPEKREAEQHLEECAECGERYKRYRIILSSIAAQPRASVPVRMRKSPFSAMIPRTGRLSIRSAWRRVPWYLRTTIEGTGVVLLILLTVSAGPKIRALYERSIERSVSEFSESMTDPASVAESIPLTRRVDLTAATAEDGSAEEFADDAEIEDGGTTSEEGNVKVGSSEVWRFNLKTDSPHEIRARVVQALTELGVAKDTPGLGGIEAPGGIQFDLLIPQASVSLLMQQLQKMAPPAPEELTDTPMGETFAWYKNKAKRQIPAGKTRVVIWLSQI